MIMGVLFHLTPAAVCFGMTASASIPPELMMPCGGGCPLPVRITSSTSARLPVSQRAMVRQPA